MRSRRASSSKREFAGYWEYVLDEALFTAPAHPQWGGAALLDGDGRLIGVGSLLVQESVEDEEVQGNMFVPVDLLEPLLDDLLKHGRASGPPRPWLGLYVAELGDHLVVNALAENGPADEAGVRARRRRRRDRRREGGRPRRPLSPRVVARARRASRCRCSCRARASCCG